MGKSENNVGLLKNTLGMPFNHAQAADSAKRPALGVNVRMSSVLSKLSKVKEPKFLVTSVTQRLDLIRHELKEEEPGQILSAVTVICVYHNHTDSKSAG